MILYIKNYFFPLFAKSDFNSPIIAPLNDTGLAGAGFGPGGGGGGALPGGPPGGPPGGGPGGPPGGPPGGDPGGPPRGAVDVAPGLDLSAVISLFKEFIRVSRDDICWLIPFSELSTKSGILRTMLIIFSIISPKALILSSKGDFFADAKKLLNSSAIIFSSFK